MQIGIIGLPQTGKTTVLNALTGAHGEVGGFHAGVQTAAAVLKVPDVRLKRLAEIFQPRKITRATIELTEIGGAFAHLGAGGGDNAEALARARDMAALLVVLRAFPDPTVFHVLDGVDTERDLSRIRDELLLADLSVVENRIANIDKDLRRAPAAEREHLECELDALQRCREAIEQERGIRSVELSPAQQKVLRSYAFLTLKPMVVVLNVGEQQLAEPPVPQSMRALEPPPVAMCGKLEMEIMELDESDRPAFMADAGLDRSAAEAIIQCCYDALGVNTFYTYAHDEVRAWPVRGGADAVEAAGKVHTDMAAGFIRAEVVAYDHLAEAGSIKEAKAQGHVRMEGRDYQVQDGDVITFRFSK